MDLLAVVYFPAVPTIFLHLLYGYAATSTIKSKGKELKASGLHSSPLVEFATTQEELETSQRQEMRLSGGWWEAEAPALAEGKA